jgi:hypothetical protein
MDANDLLNKEFFQRQLDLYLDLTAQGHINPYPEYGKTAQQSFDEERKKLLQEEDNYYFCCDLIKNMPTEELQEMIGVDSFSLAETYRLKYNKDFSDGVFILALYFHGVKLERRIEDEPLMFVSEDQPENSLLYRPSVP